MTQQERQLANSILSSKFSLLDVIRILIDIHQTGTQENKTQIIRNELEKRVLVSHKHSTPIYSSMIESLLYSFFWRECNPIIQKNMEAICDMIEGYPLYPDDEWMQDYDEWTFNLADHIQEVLNLPYDWTETNEEETQS